MQRTLVGIATCLSLLAAGGGARAQGPQPDSHAQMKLLLAEIDELQPFGTEFVLAADRIRGRISNLPRKVALTQQTAMIQRLAEAELRAARPAAAFEHLDEVGRNVSLLTASSQLRLTMMSHFWTGAFYLRQAMIGNCRGDHAGAKCTLPIRPGDVHESQDMLQDAIASLTAVLNLTQPEVPEHLAGQWLLNLAYMLIGRYPDGVPAHTRIDPRLLDAPAPRMPVFDDIAAQIGEDTFSSGGSVAADDFDADGWIDLVLSSADLRVNLKFLHNRGDGTFEDVTFVAGLDGIGGGVNLAHADYDNDGDLDLYVVRGGWLGEIGRHPNSLLRNNGDLTFTDVTFSAGLGARHYPSTAAAWADYDGDGDLDLYVANDSAGDVRKWPSQLFRNEGNGSFVDVSDAAGVRNERHAVGAVWGDYDGDGDPDLYVSNFRGDNRLYRNDGGDFTDVAAEVGVGSPRNSYTPWFWDVDGDEDLDLLVNAYRTPQTAVPDIWYYAADLMGANQPADRTHLYLNDGGRFTNVAEQYGINRVTLAAGGNFGDFDNDGFLDFYLATGYPGVEALLPNLMYRSRAGAAFQDVTWAGGFGHLQNGQGVVFADYDNDGDQDVYTRIGGLMPRDRFDDALFRNPGFDGAWLAVELRGTRSNRFGVGAIVRAVFDDHGAARSVLRVVGSGGSFGANPLRVHLGLGDARRVDRLEVVWPGSGERQVFRGIVPNRRVLITQGQDGVRTLQVGAAPDA